MTGRYLILFRKNRFSFLLTLISILLFLLILAPFVNLTVDTFPDKRGQLKDLHFFLYFPSNRDGLRFVFFCDNFHFIEKIHLTSAVIFDCIIELSQTSETGLLFLPALINAFHFRDCDIVKAKKISGVFSCIREGT